MPPGPSSRRPSTDTSDRQGIEGVTASLRRRTERYLPVLMTGDGVAAIATGLLALTSWATDVAKVGPPWLASALGLLAVLAGGSVIVVGAVRGLLARVLNVDELVAIALVASVLAGETLSGALVAFMMLAGKVLEGFTAARAEGALEDLGRLVPDMARRLHDGAEELVPLEQVLRGDAIIVRPGERIPVDGVVLSGQAAVDQAPITGESAPVSKGPGHEVYAGSLATEGVLQIETSGTGKATALGRIGTLVVEAREERAPIVRAADRYAQYFTPVVLLLAAGTYLVTRQVSPALAVLVAACPCALVLATPTAIVAGVAAGARRGLVIRGGARLEQAGRVDAVCIDKTGTLTLGDPKVISVVPVAGTDAGEVMALAAAAEQYSEHPLARAVMRRAQEEGLGPVAAIPLDSFYSYPGLGVSATVDGDKVSVGTLQLLNDLESPSLHSTSPWWPRPRSGGRRCSMYPEAIASRCSRGSGYAQTRGAPSRGRAQTRRSAPRGHADRRCPPGGAGNRRGGGNTRGPRPSAARAEGGVGEAAAGGGLPGGHGGRWRERCPRFSGSGHCHSHGSQWNRSGPGDGRHRSDERRPRPGRRGHPSEP